MQNTHIFLFSEQKVLLADADTYTGIDISTFIDEQEAFTTIRKELIRSGQVSEDDEWTCFS